MHEFFLARRFQKTHRRFGWPALDVTLVFDAWRKWIPG